jgi:uncharacterized membrane protein|tara:strand:+ start:11266 stop:11577 length:312 start_codon:yes stop_codon:yes gene_type:complete
LGGSYQPKDSNVPLNIKEIPMSDKMQAVVEATKIIGKYALVFAVIMTAIKVFTWTYLQYGVHESMASLYGVSTFMIPFFTFVVLSIVWGEAKHIVWKRNNNVE